MYCGQIAHYEYQVQKAEMPQSLDNIQNEQLFRELFTEIYNFIQFKSENNCFRF